MTATPSTRTCLKGIAVVSGAPSPHHMRGPVSNNAHSERQSRVLPNTTEFVSSSTHFSRVCVEVSNWDFLAESKELWLTLQYIYRNRFPLARSVGVHPQSAAGAVQ